MLYVDFLNDCKDEINPIVVNVFQLWLDVFPIEEHFKESEQVQTRTIGRENVRVKWEGLIRGFDIGFRKIVGNHNCYNVQSHEQTTWISMWTRSRGTFHLRGCVSVTESHIIWIIWCKLTVDSLRIQSKRLILMEHVSLYCSTVHYIINNILKRTGKLS